MVALIAVSSILKKLEDIKKLYINMIEYLLILK